METNLNTESNTKEKQERVQGAKLWQVVLLMLISAVLAAVIVIVVLLSGKTQYAIVDISDGSDASRISTLLKTIDKYYYFADEAPSNEELLDFASHEIVNRLGDPYTSYFTDEEYEAFRNEINGNYKGIGVLVSFAEGKGLKVERCYEGNPAYIAGVRDGDIITKADGVDLAPLDINSANEYLKGEDGSTVKLTVLRDGKEMEFSAKRGDVAVKRVYTEMLENNIGYLRIESFTGNAEEEFDAALDGLLGSGIDSLIIDLRNNPGGYLDSVVKICDRILPECKITTIEGNMSQKPVVYSSTAEEKLSIPFVVLVNENSASASEIFASAVQDNNAGQIIGTNTFGKGIVQSNLDFKNGMGHLKLTTDVYRTPAGNLIHGIGVAPDIEIIQADELKLLDPYFIMKDYRDKDLVLKVAIDFLMK